VAVEADPPPLHHASESFYVKISRAWDRAVELADDDKAILREQLGGVTGYLVWFRAERATVLRARWRRCWRPPRRSPLQATRSRRLPRRKAERSVVQSRGGWLETGLSRSPRIMPPGPGRV